MLVPNELMTVGDAIDWVVWHLAGERRNYRYHLHPNALDESGRPGCYLFHTVRKLSYSGRSPKEVDREWIRVADGMRARLERDWPVSDATGGRIPQSAVGVMRILAGSEAVDRARFRARRFEWEQKWAGRASTLA